MFAVFALVLGCTTTGDSLSGQALVDDANATAGSGNTEQGAQTMSALERRLIDAKQVDLTFEIQSTGAVASTFSGSLHWTSDGELRLRATGEFDGVAQQLELRGDAQTVVTLADGHQVWTGPRPHALIEAIVLGLTRQGLLHNLAILTVGSTPERGDGGIAQWLTYVEPQLGVLQPFGEADAQPLEFGVHVEGQPVGRATLWLRPNGLPIERHQAVVFPSGSMDVVERYPTWITQ
jgi:hypothetical protein